MLRTYLACYALYALLLVLCYLVFVIWLQTIQLVLPLVDENQDPGPALLGLGAIVVGLSLYLLVLVAEPYLRGGVPKGQLRARFLRLAGPLVVIFVVGAIAQELIRVMR